MSRVFVISLEKEDNPKEIGLCTYPQGNSLLSKMISSMNYSHIKFASAHSFTCHVQYLCTTSPST